MNLLEKIEDFINFLLLKIGQLFLIIIPQPVKNRISNFKTKVGQKKKSISQKLSVILGEIFRIITYLPSKLKVALTVATAFALAVTNKLKDKSFVRNFLSTITTSFFGPIKKLLTVLSAKIGKLRPQTIALIIVMSALLALAGLVIVGNTKKIIDSTGDQVVDEVSSPQNLRKDYYQQDDRQLLVSEITIPIYVGKGNAPRTLILDITLKTSNRYLKSYFYENDYLLKDRLNRTIEPVIPTLPLEEEGKRIIKEKIIFELNQLIKDRKIQGHIEDVYFHNIING